MTKGILATVAVLMLAAYSSHAQRLTPLQHLITSHALVERPETFRTMQLAIEKEWGKTRKGVQLQLLDDRMTKFRETVTALFDTSIVTVNDTIIDANVRAFAIYVRIKRPHFSETICIPRQGISLLHLQDMLTTELAKRLRSLFELAAERATDELSKMNAPVLQDVVQTAVEQAMNELGADGGDVPERIASMITSRLFEYMREFVRSVKSLNPASEYFWPTINPDKVEITRDTLRFWIRTGIQRVGETVTGVLDKAENAVRSVVDRFNRVLLSADAGLSVAQGEGDFGAGIHVSYTWSTSLQLGVFVDGEFQPDSTKSAVGLFGGQIRYADDAMQFDAIVSALRGRNWGLEAGLGLAYRSSPNILVGFGFFGSVLPVEVTGSAGTSNRIYGWSAAFTIRGTDPTSPTLVIGAGKVDGAKVTPLFQIVYPINARL